MSEQIGRMHVQVDGDTSGLNNSVAGAQLKATNAFKKVGSAAGGMITGALVAAVAAVAVGLTAGAAAAVNFEKAFAGVKKTLSATPEQFKQVSDELINMARFLPQTAAELSAIAQVAGQLGVSVNDVAKFTETIAKLGGASDLSGEAGATAMARFMKVIGVSVDNMDGFANVLVDLGNNMATTESEIINLALNFGALGSQVGLSGEEVLAFSAAMREMGQPAAAGATALNKLFTNLNKAVLGEGGLAEFAEIAGMSMFEFQAIAEESMAAAAAAVLEGLNAMGEAQMDQVSALDSVGLARDRVSRALISMAKNEQGLAKARKIASEQIFTQSALEEEFAKKQDTVAGQYDILKSKMNSFGVTLGQALLPFLKKVVESLGRFFDGLIFITQAIGAKMVAVKALGAAIGASALVVGIKKLIGLFGKLTAKFKAGGDIVEGVAKKVGFFGKILAKGKFFFGGIVTGAVGAFKAVQKFGDLQERIDSFGASVGDLTSKFNILKQQGVGGMDQLTDEILKNMIEGMDKGSTKTVLDEMFKSGELTTDDAQALAALGKNMSDELLQEFKDQLGVGTAGAKGFTIAGLKDITDEMKAQGLEGSELFKETENLRKTLIANSGHHNDITKAMEAQLIAKLAFVEAGKASMSVEEKMRFLVVQNLGDLVTFSGKTEEDIMKIISTLPGLEKFVGDFALGIEGMPALYDILFPKDLDPIQEALKQLKEDAQAFKQMVADVFAPTEAQFKLEFAEMDLADAHKDHADLHDELGDLHQEDADLQQELVDLQNAELLTHEEKLAIQEMQVENQELINKHATEAAMTFEEQVSQQKLINEALEIEQRLRDGLALSANDQLKREKLRKDRRRVELAIQQGSLEFGDLELQAIDENIKAIESKAVTETDGILKRRKAADIAAKADLRREKEKEQIAKNIKEINEINLESVARRNEEIIEIENRRIAIEERLKEIPREIKEAHFDIHNAQKEVLDRTADIQIGFMEMRSVSEKEMKALAEAIGMPLDKLDGMMTLMNHLRVESSKFIDDIVTAAEQTPHQFAQSPGGGPSVSDIQRKGYGFLQQGTGIVDFLRHGGGGFKSGNNFIAGEYGPELIKTFAGGGMVTPLGDRGSGSQNNTINLNITGLPSDPIATRRIVQNISRELHKLDREGRSGVVR